MELDFSEPTPRPYEAVVQDGVLTITVRKEFDFGTLHQNWPSSIQAAYPGPYHQVIFDLSRCGLVSSTFFAGLLNLHLFYTQAPGSHQVRLVAPDPRVVRNLKLMKFDSLFHIVPRETMTELQVKSRPER